MGVRRGVRGEGSEGRGEEGRKERGMCVRREGKRGE